MERRHANMVTATREENAMNEMTATVNQQSSRHDACFRQSSQLTTRFERSDKQGGCVDKVGGLLTRFDCVELLIV